MKQIVDPAKAVIGNVGGAVSETGELLKQSGPLTPGIGIASGVVALTLGILCFLGVLAFHFPQYLTTPELRHKYNPDIIRHIMFGALVIAGSISLLNVLFKRQRGLNGVAAALVLATLALGGSHVPVADFPDNTPYIGMDWFILDLLGSTVIFAAIEKLFPLYKGQLLFRKEWQTDMVHFAVNHFIVGLALLTVNFAIHRLFGWMANDAVHAAVQSIHFIPQLLLCILAADFVQYWTHRSYHEIPFLWRFHAVHHSAKTMDWLAGSRQHMFELIVTRVGVLGILYVLGFEKSVMDAYIVIVGFQAVFNHANVHLPWGPIKYFIVTPDFHHWHHSSDDVAIDKNYAAHYAFLDRIFGTAIKGQTGFPEKYGVQGDYMPDGFTKQFMFPFRKQK
ncbi:sterol desaturase family protein [Massilia sp. CF038]|uniref:sterol desaturase family protein n=1 Tax=Massilia sp. CF038 TaxID=1881045 RepID=UPI00091AD5D8|nr:sterol desaturase family protein [Massilia sp. CF038]SHG58783.1 Sterol desaturase/sphingolipid hydroxylase, fatty acid hydroxylase superfamily [Massilia sp. CF038]